MSTGPSKAQKKLKKALTRHAEPLNLPTVRMSLFAENVGSGRLGGTLSVRLRFLLLLGLVLIIGPGGS